MLRRLLTFALSIGLLSSVNSVADRISENDAVLLQRVYALVYPDILKAMCSKQRQELKDRAERALAGSGLLTMSLKDVCADDVCVKATGGDRYPTDDSAVREMINNFRDEQVGSWEARSSIDMEKICTIVVEGMEKAGAKKGLKPEQVVKEVAEYIRDRL